MRRNKIKPKYLSIIMANDKEDEVSNSFNKMEKKLLKGLISFMWVILMLFWGIIPSVVLALLGIDISNLSDTTKIIITFINDLLFLGLLIGVYYKTLKKDMVKYFKYNFKDNIKQAISYWLIGLGIMFVSNLIISIIMNGELAENEESVRYLIQIAPLYMVFQLVVYAPITEELIFRKSIRDIISNNYLFAIISGLIFGGLHVISSLTNIWGLLYLIPYCSLGIAFGFLYAKSDNIFSTMSVHAMHNSLALLLYLTAL